MFNSPHQINSNATQPQVFDLYHQYAGKLLLREEILLEESFFQTLLEANKFTKITSIVKNKWSYICKRCNNGKRSLFAEIPCARCERTHVYCRKCIEMGRILACESLYLWTGEQPKWPVHHAVCLWDGKLTDVQQNASNAIVRSIQNNEKEMLVWGVCGAGKTEMIFQGISAALESGKRICIATPRADVVRELYPRFQTAFPEVNIQALYGGNGEKNSDAQLMIVTTHQLLRFYQAFDVVIIDEIDAFPFHADPSLPFATERAKKQLCTTIYLTATPRKQQATLIKSGKLPHVFVPRRFHGHPLPVPQFKMAISLKRNLRKGLPPPSFFRWLKNRDRKMRQLLIFVPTIQMANIMKKVLGQLFVSGNFIKTIHCLDTVHAKDPCREDKVRNFREKELFILITTTILERGVTFPSIDVVVLDAGHQVFDEAALIQIAGRAGRSSEDPAGEVVFFHDGRTNAMIDAVYSIRKMNKRGGF